MTQQPITPDELDATTSALSGGVASMARASAVAEIETWQQKLEASGDPGLQKIGRDLGDLREHLMSEDLDTGAVGTLLESLGEQTKGVGVGSLPAFVVEKTRALGDLLSEQGRKVSG
jgi:hypothetical protein